MVIRPLVLFVVMPLIVLALPVEYAVPPAMIGVMNAPEPPTAS